MPATDPPADELARVKAELALTKQWLEEAKRDLAAAHVEIGELKEQLKGMNRG